MSTLRSIFADVDFEYPGSLDDLAAELSQRAFGGIPFVGKNSGIWDEVPAVRLETRFLGLEVQLGGHDGHFGVSIDTFEFPQHKNSAEEKKNERVDIAEYVLYLLERVPGLRRE